MSKAILMSIQPKWCELIALGKKTVEVRKTRPKLEPPFKVYIYCTKPKMITRYVFRPEDYPEYMRPEKTVFCKTPDASSPYCSVVNGNSKVIGEFTCNLITGLKANNGIQTYYNGRKETCLTDVELIKYASGKMIYYWHISDLKIYDEPKELSNFYTFCKGSGSERDKQCIGCPHLCFDNDPINGYSRWCGANKQKSLTRPPQSWCYVEEVSD